MSIQLKHHIPIANGFGYFPFGLHSDALRKRMERSVCDSGNKTLFERSRQAQWVLFCWAEWHSFLAIRMTALTFCYFWVKPKVKVIIGESQSIAIIGISGKRPKLKKYSLSDWTKRQFNSMCISKLSLFAGIRVHPVLKNWNAPLWIGHSLKSP